MTPIDRQELPQITPPGRQNSMKFFITVRSFQPIVDFQLLRLKHSDATMNHVEQV